MNAEVMIRLFMPASIMISAGLGAYIGVLRAIAALRLELHQELSKRDVRIESHEERIEALRCDCDDLEREVEGMT
jgi:hypothetical protein